MDESKVIRGKTLGAWKKYASENSSLAPVQVLKYIVVLEEELRELSQNIPAASNYYLCEYINWDGDKKVRVIAGDSEEDVRHRVIGHGMQLISINQIYLSK